MKNKKVEYICLLGFFLLFLIGSGINSIIINLDNNLKKEFILSDYKEEIKRNYKDLEDIKELSQENGKLILSKIKYRNMYDFNKKITIYKGFKDNIKVGDAVVVNDGLVGIITKTYDYSSDVELLSNKESEVSVRINESYGILKYDDGMVVKEINNYQNIEVGDKIYTSGLGNLPGGIYVGDVSEVKLNNTEIEKIVKVNLGVDLNKINYLYIYGGKNV